MIEQVFYIAAALLVAGAVVLLLRRPRRGFATGTGRPPASSEFFPVHCRYFPQVRHALTAEDAPYLASHASPEVYRRWRKSTRKAGRLYLAALREDFSRLNRLARVISLHSPRVRFQQELELLRMNFYFQFLYGGVVLRFLLGRPAGDRLEQMASFIVSVGGRLEQAALAPHISAGAVTP